MDAATWRLPRVNFLHPDPPLTLSGRPCCLTPLANTLKTMSAPLLSQQWRYTAVAINATMDNHSPSTCTKNFVSVDKGKYRFTQPAWIVTLYVCGCHPYDTMTSKPSLYIPVCEDDAQVYPEDQLYIMSLGSALVVLSTLCWEDDPASDDCHTWEKLFGSPELLHLTLRR